MKSKRAQAALEFLTTYSWALLIIAVMIGAIVYFGVVNPTSFVKERCFISLDLYCVDSVVYNNGIVKLVLKNQLQDPIDELNVTCKYVSSQSSVQVSVSQNNLGVNPQENVEVTCDPADVGATINYNVGAVVKVIVSGYYKTSNANDVYPNYFEGELIAKVAQAPPSGGGSGIKFPLT